jgi:twitching motility protein PilU
MFIHKLFALMKEKSASDLFISAGSAIHLKVNGEAVPINPQIIDPETAKNICYEMLTPLQKEMFEETRELNFSTRMADVGLFRVNMFWQRGAVGLVARYVLFDIPDCDKLGLPPVLKQLVMEKRGLMLVVGATGSGKSTTLASLIDFRNATSQGHILTMEDPIEYVFKSRKSIVNQREIGVDSVSYGQALKNAMRQAPDVIFIGEIRDTDTMRMAMTYALSGHLCLATLHANNSYQALNRIINFFPLEARGLLLLDLSVCLKAIVGQRLIKNTAGGRMPMLEIMLNTRLIQELIEKADVNEIREAMEKSLAPGSQTFDQDLYKNVKAGKITPEIALSYADSPTNLSLLMGNTGIKSSTGDSFQDKMKNIQRAMSGAPSGFDSIVINPDPDSPLPKID